MYYVTVYKWVCQMSAVFALLSCQEACFTHPRMGSDSVRSWRWDL